MAVKNQGIGPTALRTFTWPDYDATVLTSGGALVTGTIGAGASHARTDAALELQGSSALASLFNTRNPGVVNSDESALCYSAYDAAGTIAKTASISAKWRVATGGAAAGVLRLNATTSSGAVDNVSLRIFGDQGIDVFGSSDTVGPGAGKFRVTGSILATTIDSGTDVPILVKNLATTVWVVDDSLGTLGSGTSFAVFPNTDNARGIGTPTKRPYGIWLGTILSNAGYYEGTEMTPPGAGAVNTGRLYFDDSGGKTRLMVIFNTGVAIQLAIQV